MAIIDCPECKREASSTLSSCPHCGYRLASVEVGAIDRRRLRAQRALRDLSDDPGSERSAVICAVISIFLAPVVVGILFGSLAIHYSRPGRAGYILGWIGATLSTVGTILAFYWLAKFKGLI